MNGFSGTDFSRAPTSQKFRKAIIFLGSPIKSRGQPIKRNHVIRRNQRERQQTSLTFRLDRGFPLVRHHPSAFLFGCAAAARVDPDRVHAGAPSVFDGTLGGGLLRPVVFGREARPTPSDSLLPSRANHDQEQRSDI